MEINVLFYYTLDKDNDFILFDTHDEFGLALNLNKGYLEIFVCNKTASEFREKCSNCQCEVNYIYQCLNCRDTVLCKRCFETHAKNESHFGILEKCHNFQIHPFFYRELKMIIQGDIQDDSVMNIGSYFQRLIGNFGISFIDNTTNHEETPRNSPDITEGYTTLQTLNLGNPDNQRFVFEFNEALRIMESMGFTDNNAWLKEKLIEFDGDIPKTVDWIDRNIGRNNL